MKIITEKISLTTKGDTDIHDITSHIQIAVESAALAGGNVTLFVSGSTAGLTTVEFEPGLVKDLKEIFEKLAPSNKEYHHNERWHDDNGHSHVRASLLGPSLTVPFSNKKLCLGTWQQIVFIDFDNRPRKREIVVQIIGE